MPELWVCHLGRVDYTEAAALQERLRERVRASELPETMLLLEHPPVYTVGPAPPRAPCRSPPAPPPPRARPAAGLARHRGGQDAARRPADLPRPRPARRLSHHAR